MPKKQRLGEILLKKGLVTQEALDEALRIQIGGNRRLGRVLIKMDLLTDKQLVEALSDQLSLPFIRVEDEFRPEAKRILPKFLCRKYSVIPLSLQKNKVLKLAMIDPLDDEAIEDIERYTGYVVEAVLASPSDVLKSIKKKIPASAKDLMNPELYGLVARVAASAALVLVLVVAFFAYRYIRTERYGMVSVVGSAKVFKNHDLMVGLEEEGKISLLGHGVYSKGYYSVSFNSVEALRNFIEKQKDNLSQKQYDWLVWVMEKRLPRR